MSQIMHEINQPNHSLDAFLLKHQLRAPNEAAKWSELTGGVSSDIWRVDLPGRSLCVKRALPTLKVAADWFAPVNRNSYEWAWLEFAHQYCPDNVPTPLAHDATMGLFAMCLLEPSTHPVWKGQLLEGVVSPDTARQLGFVLAHIHSSSAGNADVEADFATDENFRALRLDPYLIATAEKNPRVAHILMKLVEEIASTKIALIHGDVSPKNILVGPKGPVLLDAECAWYGDPAFDLAFCLNHLFLKCLVRGDRIKDLSDAITALSETYLHAVDWESAENLEGRTARLLPALLLARIDGKSPVEYLTEQADKELVRSFALQMLCNPQNTVQATANAWHVAVTQRDCA